MENLPAPFTPAKMLSGAVKSISASAIPMKLVILSPFDDLIPLVMPRFILREILAIWFALRRLATLFLQTPFLWK